MPYGTLQIDDAFIDNTQTVAAYGEERLANELVQPSLARHEAWVREMGSFFCEITTDFLRYYGEVGDVENEEMGEQSRPDASKADVETVNIGFSLRRFGSSLQWTKDSLRVLTVGEFARQMDSHANMDRRRVIQRIKVALFTPSNNLTYKDTLPSRKTKGLTLPVRALYNADGTLIPDGPHGEQFDGSHTHYLARAGASLASSDVFRVINTVTEHDTEARPVLLISQAEESAVRGMTGAGEFAPYVDSRIVQPQSATYANGQALNVRNAADRAIGIFGPAEVWVKPWEPNSYMMALDTNGDKVCAWRIPEDDPTLGNFDVRAEDEAHPLRARTMARDFDISIARRHKAAILYTGGTSYVKPTSALAL